MTETRRRALKILGTIGATCAFPFAGDELYGQHVQHTVLFEPSQSGPYKPGFFTADEYATLSRLADLIIPATDTPGAVEAGVPEYVDRIVTLNTQHQSLMRTGLGWLERQSRTQFSRNFLSIDEAQCITLLQPLSDAIDRQQRETLRARFRTDAQGVSVYYAALTDNDPPARSPSSAAAGGGSSDPDIPVRFFRLVKNLTADGYYTSRVGLLQELGYSGNTALAAFPGCKEH